MIFGSENWPEPYPPKWPEPVVPWGVYIFRAILQNRSFSVFGADLGKDGWLP